MSGPAATAASRGAAAFARELATDAAKSDETKAEETKTAVADAARRGLLRARKRLPAWLLYDDEGSALFEAITRLPEYYLTRTERAILRRDAGAMIDAAGGPLEVVELGAGSASKTRLLLEAALARQPRVRYVPVDVS